MIALPVMVMQEIMLGKSGPRPRSIFGKGFWRYLRLGAVMAIVFFAIGGTMQWRASWTDTRGHFWRIVISHLLTALPIQIGVVSTFIVYRALSTVLDANALAYLLAFGLPLFAATGLIVGAACSCWLCRRFAQTLLESA